MALIKQYGLAGVNEDVQFGKGNGRIKFDTSDNIFAVRDLADSNYVNIRVAEPLVNSDAATKYYVDSMAQGLKPRKAVRVATNSLTTTDSNVSGGSAPDDMLNLSYAGDVWTLTGGVIDGVTLADGDRVLIKDHGTGIGNGIWVYGSASGKLTRAPDADNQPAVGLPSNADTDSELSGGVFVFVLEGDVWADSGWVVSSPTGNVICGTTPVEWAQFSRVTGVYADDGLAQDGNRIYVRVDGTTIHLDSDDLAVKSSNTQYQTLISDGSGGTATWGAVNLGQAAATTGTLLRSRGGMAADVSAFADQSLYLSDGTNNSTTELAVGSNYQVLRVNGSGTLGYGAVDLGQTGTSVTGVLDETNGGTGESSYSQYDLLYGDGGNKLAKLSVGLNNQVLRVSGAGVLEYGAVDLAAANAVTNTLPESHGGTGQDSYTKGDLLYASSTGADGSLAKLAIGTGTSTQVLSVSSGDTPVWTTATSLKGIESTRQVTLGTSDVNIGSILPANSRITSVKVVVTSAYTSGAEIVIGRTGATSELASADEIDAQSTGIYQIDTMHLYGSATQLLATVTGASAGAGYVIVTYVAE